MSTSKFSFLHYIGFALVLGLGLISYACVPSGAPAKQLEYTKAQEKLPTAVLRSGAIEVVAEIAKTDEQKTRGLMFRKEILDGNAMIFIYYEDIQLSFWMKNTLIPLSIAYLSSDGTIKEILDMEPRSLAAVPSAHYVRYALEVPLGWFSRVGLSEGAKFEFPAGFPPR